MNSHQKKSVAIKFHSMRFFISTFCIFRFFLFSEEIAVVQLSFDGVTTFHCGVGTVIQQTQTVLKEFNVKNNNDLFFKLYLISGDYSNQLPEYSERTLKNNIRDCQASEGEVHLIPIKIHDQMFGNPDQWKELCEKGVETCAEIINANTYTIIIAHDTAFAQIPLKLSQLAETGKITRSYQAIWVPHATSWSYNGHNTENHANWPERHAWELESFQKAAQYNYKIGYISPSIKELMLSYPFNVSESALIPYRTGIILDKYLNPISQEEIEAKLKEKSIPLNKKLIFSIGRANPLKGLDITLEMYRHLSRLYSDIHLVLLAPASDYMPSYLSMLKERIKNECLEVTLVDQFDSDLANYIYQWHNTVLISLLSRMDTQPLTVMEARVNPKNSIVLVSEPERIGEQVIHGCNGFSCSLKDLNAVIDKPSPLNDSLEQIVSTACAVLNLSAQEREEIIQAGKEMIKNDYDLHENMKKNIQILLKSKN